MTQHLPGAPPSAVSRSSFSNLKITRPGVNTVTVTADDLVLYASNLNPFVVHAVSVTPDKTTAGPAANGRDQAGAFSNSSWVYIWVISDGTTTAGLLSASSTAPTLPSGYTYKALVGAARIDSGGNFINFTQRGRDCFYTAWQQLFNGTTGSAGTWTSMDTTPVVPNGISEVCFGMANSGASNVPEVTNDNTVSALVGTQAANKILDGGVGGVAPHIAFEFDMITANTLWVAGNGAVGVIVYIAGFRLSKLW